MEPTMHPCPVCGDVYYMFHGEVCSEACDAKQRSWAEAWAEAFRVARAAIKATEGHTVQKFNGGNVIPVWRDPEVGDYLAAIDAVFSSLTDPTTTKEGE
jgi:hypothetical protein